MLKETLDQMEKDVKLGASKPRDVLNLIKKHREMLDWEETSFEEVDSVISATGELDDLINVAQGFPASTIEGLQLLRRLSDENAQLRGDNDKLKRERDKARAETKKANGKIRSLQADLGAAARSAEQSASQAPEAGSSMAPEAGGESDSEADG